MNKNIQIIKTQDGSLGLYNKELDEIYHSKFGAKTESFEKFVEPCLDFIQNKNLKILDICYGIGYNTKTALKYFKNVDLIDCIEIDKDLIEKSSEFDFDDEINEIIKNNIRNPNFIYFYIDDVRKIIKKLDKKYDIIFHDGFAPHKQPELWSEELINQITLKMDYNSIYVTYNHSKPVLCALFKQGLILGKTIKNQKTIATIASFNPDLVKNKLNDCELGELNTKSAITYKDKNLSSTSKEILRLRDIEIKNSNLESLSYYKKKNKKEKVWKKFYFY